ncbi:Ku protein [Ideonella sp. YS5]|uniref:non-homologous end joining protein Ku n=1 Tax=Ideonella sp. YS5 TaxID=3453714 RepID=UPI003EE94A95
MPRAIWKGAISFGLVHIPVALYPASSSRSIDFDWLDKRNMDPVGYKRINKRTGKEIDKDNIVKGVKVEGGEYVILGADEIKAAYPKTTQTISIEAFVHAREVPFTHLETPYYLEPQARGDKPYALLREAMLEAGVIGIARIVLHTKEHLAALVPAGPALMLNTLRWANEIRPLSELNLPAEGKRGAGLKDGELKMARQLIDDMIEPLRIERYDDQFAKAIELLVEQRAAAGHTEHVEPMEEGEAPRASNVVDLTELLKRSLGRQGEAQKEAPAAKKAPARKSPARSSQRAAARKRA